MTYTIVKRGSETCVYLTSVDPPQYLNETDLSQWMRDTRDDNPDLYAELVSAFMQLRKATSSAKSHNPSSVSLSAIAKDKKRKP
jgi:hypothetical protein